MKKNNTNNTAKKNNSVKKAVAVAEPVAEKKVRTRTCVEPLTADEAASYSNMTAMFGDWQPTVLTEQAPVPTNVKAAGLTMTWDDSNYALLWAVCKDGVVVDFTTAVGRRLGSDRRQAWHDDRPAEVQPEGTARSRQQQRTDYHAGPEIRYQVTLTTHEIERMNN